MAKSNKLHKTFDKILNPFLFFKEVKSMVKIINNVSNAPITIEIQGPPSLPTSFAPDRVLLSPSLTSFTAG